MIGGFADDINVGDIVIPPRAYIEEGTSLHYYETIDYSTRDTDLFDKITCFFDGHKELPVVSTDAVFRQTFYKESLWREKGAAGVDMETSALFSVGKYLGIKVVSILMVSDKHPMHEEDKKWSWKMTKELRRELICKCVEFALTLNQICVD